MGEKCEEEGTAERSYGLFATSIPHPLVLLGCGEEVEELGFEGTKSSLGRKYGQEKKGWAGGKISMLVFVSYHPNLFFFFFLKQR